LFRKAPAATVLVRNGSRAFEPFSVRAPPGHAAGAELPFFIPIRSEDRLDVGGVGHDPDLGGRTSDPPPARPLVRGPHEQIRDHGGHEPIVVGEPLPVIGRPPEQAGQNETEDEATRERDSGGGESPRGGVLRIHGGPERKDPQIKASEPNAFAAVTARFSRPLAHRFGGTDRDRPTSPGPLPNLPAEQ